MNKNILEHLGEKKSCKYYNACGNVENCLNCTGYVKKKKEKKNENINR